MADKTVKTVPGRGRFARDQSSIQQKIGHKTSEEEKLLKERLLDEKMKLIRQQNEERLRRQREIEEDIKNASLHSHEVGEQKPAPVDHHMSGVQKESSTVPKMRGRARGQILAKMAKEELQAHKFENERKQNYELVEKELQEEKTKSSPPPGGSSSFLSDDRRVDMSKVASRSSYSWGGSQFEDVVEKVSKEHSRPRRDHQNIELSMAGKERKEYLEWKVERNRIDKERKLRQKSGETWQREWDKCKVQREANSLHEKRDQHNSRRSGQRFGERTRRRPDWDLHDDRVENTEQNFHVSDNGTDKERDVGGIEPSEERGESNDPKQNIVSKEAPTEKINVAQKEDSTTNEADNKELQEPTCTSQKLIEPTFEKTDKSSDVDNLTIIVDSEGNRNIKNVSSVINNNINEHPGELNKAISHEDELDKDSYSVEPDKIIEQPKPQRVQKKHRQKEEKETRSENHQEKMDERKGMVKNDKKNTLLKSDIVSDKTPSPTQNMSMSGHPTSEDTLPKLDIRKIEENKEPVPDFLKTPLKKNWGDCEFEEELELPPLEWDSLTKCLNLE